MTRLGSLFRPQEARFPCMTSGMTNGAKKSFVKGLNMNVKRNENVGKKRQNVSNILKKKII